MSSLDDLRYGGLTVKIKSHRNPEFLECVCVYKERKRRWGKNVYLWRVESCKDFSPVSSFSNKEMESKD